MIKTMEQTIKLSEKQLRQFITEAINELDWKTYANASKKANEWRKEHPFNYDRNRGFAFDRAAQDAFDKQMGIDNQDTQNHGGERGNINMTVYHGEPELSGSRNHNFGDDGGPFGLKHNVYHMGKQYGKDGGYGRTRMWDYTHETTPEEFYDDEKMGQKFRDAEQEVDNYKTGKYSYDNEKGWHLNESKLRTLIRESIIRILNENSAYASMDDFSKIEEDLKQYGAKVDRDKSDEKFITLVIPKEIGVSDRVQIGKYMRDWWHGYFHNMEELDNYIVITFLCKKKEITVADFEEFDNSEIAELFEKLLGVQRVGSPEEWHALLETLAREVRKRNLSMEELHNMLNA